MNRQVQEMTVVHVGGRIPKIRINVNDPDYQEKLENHDNYHPAVVCRPDGEDYVTPVISYRECKVGDRIQVISAV